MFRAIQRTTRAQRVGIVAGLAERLTASGIDCARGKDMRRTE